jgi:hypothetical protein
MKKLIFNNVLKMLLVTLGVVLLEGCAGLLPSLGIGKPNWTIEDWIMTDVRLLAEVMQLDDDGNLVIRLQYEKKFFPLLTCKINGKIYHNLDYNRQPEKRLENVPAGEKIAIVSRSDILYDSLVDENSCVKFSKSQSLVEGLSADPKRNTPSTFQILNIEPNSSSGIADERRFEITSEYQVERVISAKSTDIDVSGYISLVLAVSEQKAIDLEKKIAALNDKYPLTTDGLSDYEKEVKSLGIPPMLEPETAVIESAITTRRNELDKILTTPNEFAQLGSYSYSTQSSNVHVIILPEGKAEIVVLYKNYPYRQFTGYWARTDNGFYFNHTANMQSHHQVFEKTGNTYKVTENNATIYGVQFNKNATTVSGLYMTVEEMDGGRLSFVFQDGNTVELSRVRSRDTNIISLGKGTYTITGNIVRMNMGREAYLCYILGNMFLGLQGNYGITIFSQWM